MSCQKYKNSHSIIKNRLITHEIAIKINITLSSLKLIKKVLKFIYLILY